MSAEPEPGQRCPRSCACPPHCSNTGHGGFALPLLCKSAIGALSQGHVGYCQAGAELAVLGTWQGQGSCNGVMTAASPSSPALGC